MQRMQKEWREEERRRKEKMDGEELEKDVDEEDTLLTGVKSKKGKKGKRKGGGAEEGEEEGDIWAGIKAKRIEVLDGQGGLVGLHDVVQAPPKLLKIKEKNSSDFGKIGKGGGLKRIGELSEARKGVMQGYRALMRERREGME